MRKKMLYSMLVAAFVLGCVVVKNATAGADKAAKKEKAKPAATEKVEAKKEAVEAKVEAKKEVATEAKAEGGPAEFIKFAKTGAMAPVNFPHKMHGEKNKCDACHGGATPLFAQKIGEGGTKMKDMYAGKACGACHDGKKAFKAQGGCMKCHKK